MTDKKKTPFQIITEKLKDMQPDNATYEELKQIKKENEKLYNQDELYTIDTIKKDAPENRTERIEYYKNIVKRLDEIISNNGSENFITQLKGINEYSRMKFDKEYIDQLNFADNLINIRDELKSYITILKGDRGNGTSTQVKSENKSLSVNKKLLKLSEKLGWKSGDKELERHLILLKEKELSINNIKDVLSGEEIPCFNRGEEYKAAVSLLTYWKEKQHITFKLKGGMEIFSYDIIRNSFYRNTFNNEWKQRSLETAVQTVKKDQNKIEVFKQLLDNK